MLEKLGAVVGTSNLHIYASVTSDDGTRVLASASTAEKEVREQIGAAGKVVGAFDIARMMALGADWCNSARGFMFAIGCIQSQHCHTNKCPTGVATQDPLRQRALVVPDKAERVHNFHRNTLKALAEMLAAAGLERPDQLEPHHLVRRISDTEVRTYSQVHVFLKPGELLESDIQYEFYRRMWRMARADSFEANRS